MFSKLLKRKGDTNASRGGATALVINEFGETELVPVVLPGQQRIGEPEASAHREDR